METIYIANYKGVVEGETIIDVHKLSPDGHIASIIPIRVEQSSGAWGRKDVVIDIHGNIYYFVATKNEGNYLYIYEPVE